MLTRSKPFWGQFWGQICETDSRTLQSNKCAALVPLRNADTNITKFSHRKSQTNRYISFTLRQEVVRKHYSTQSPHTASVAARNASVFVDVRAANRIYSLPCDIRKVTAQPQPSSKNKAGAKPGSSKLQIFFLQMSGSLSDHGSRSFKNARSFGSCSRPYRCSAISSSKKRKYSYGFKLLALAVSAML